MSYDWDRVGVLTSIYIRWYQNESSMCDLSGQRCHLISGLQKCLAEKKCAESPHWWEYGCLCLMHHSHHVLEKNQYPGVICRFCLIKNPEKHRIRTNTGAKSPQLTHTNTHTNTFSESGEEGGIFHCPPPSSHSSPFPIPLLFFLPSGNKEGWVAASTHRKMGQIQQGKRTQVQSRARERGAGWQSWSAGH